MAPVVAPRPLPVPLPSEPQLDQHRRGDLWVRVAVYSIVWIAAAPVAYYVAPRVHDPVMDRLVSFGLQTTEPGGSLRLVVDNGAGVWAVLALAPALLIAGACWFLRSRASRRFVDAYRGGHPIPSRSVGLTLLAWAAIMVGCCVAGVGYVVSDGLDQTDGVRRFVTNPAWMVLTPLGFGAAAALSAWVHRRRRELEPLLASGHAVYAEPPARPEVPTFRLGLRTYLGSVALEAGFIVIAVVGGALDQSGDGGEGVLTRMATGMLVVPAAVAFALMLLFRAIPPLRWVVRDAWSLPVVRVAVWSFLGGMALTTASGVLSAIWQASANPDPFVELHEPWWVVAPMVVGGVVAFAGCAIAAFTGLYLQDLGPQPWCGGMVLVTVYWMGFVGSDGETVWPTSPTAWFLAAVLGTLTVRELRELSRTSHGRVELIVPTSPVEAPA